MERRGKKTKRSAFVLLLWQIWDSWAWGQLTNAARVAYIGILRQKDKPGQTEMEFPYGDAERLMHRKTFKKAIDELLEWGFIMMRQRGGLKRRTNIYSLSEEWRIRSERNK
jgi:hypothetical protein